MLPITSIHQKHLTTSTMTPYGNTFIVVRAARSLTNMPINSFDCYVYLGTVPIESVCQLTIVPRIESFHHDQIYRWSRDINLPRNFFRSIRICKLMTCCLKSSNSFVYRSPNSLRIVSYNILANGYASSGDAPKTLFSHCPEEFLDHNYRKPLILKEIIGLSQESSIRKRRHLYWRLNVNSFRLSRWFDFLTRSWYFIFRSRADYSSDRKWLLWLFQNQKYFCSRRWSVVLPSRSLQVKSSIKWDRMTWVSYLKTRLDF